ncbi:hypothetical protein KUTeg_015296 [Tegillarca granosa]|uniref:Uncharacterized protein n=1 Tax=Tegillarca granosa TaxID=220873 RepID=A0ABQ9EUF5_TEGGR|nr:hypothetical protein KUTeg_015296 [Tegillarca granosa]
MAGKGAGEDPVNIQTPSVQNASIMPFNANTSMLPPQFQMVSTPISPMNSTQPVANGLSSLTTPPPPQQHYQQYGCTPTQFQVNAQSNTSNQNRYSDNIPPTWAREIMCKIDEVNKRLGKMDELEMSIKSMSLQLNSVTTDVKEIRGRVSEPEKSQKYISDSFEKTLMINETSSEKPPKKKKKKDKKSPGQSGERGVNNNMAGKGAREDPVNIQTPSVQNASIMPFNANTTHNRLQMDFRSLTNPPPPQQHYQQYGCTPTQFQVNAQSNTSNQNRYSDNIPPTWAREIMCKIDGVNKRLGKMDELEMSIKSMSLQLNSVTTDVKEIRGRVSEPEKSQKYISNSFEKLLTEELHNIFSPFCKKEHKVLKEINHCDRPLLGYKTVPKYEDDKPWFTFECKQLYRSYLQSLRDFNKNKTDETHYKLHATKRKYKALETKLKRDYLQQQGDMTSNMKQKKTSKN